MRLPLLYHRVVFRSADVERIAFQVLEDEHLALNDLKARILQRAYLPKGGRALLLVPQDVKVDPSFADARFPGRLACRVHFSLPRGGYATLVLKAAAMT